MEYHIGDRVRMIEDYEPGVYKGDMGTVVRCDDKLIIRWDDWNEHKHDSDGQVEGGHGWFVFPSQIELVPPMDFGELPEMNREEVTKFLFDM